MKGPDRKRRTIDWDAARQRLEHSRAALERALEPGPERRAAVLRARAERLARTAVQQTSVEGAEVLVFRLGKDRYGIELARVAEVVPAPRCSPVPGGPHQLAGVMQLRGEIRPVWETARLLGREGAGAEDEPRWVLLLNRGKKELGLLVDRVEGIRRIGAEEQRPAGRQPDHVRYITQDSVAVLEIDELLKQILS